MRIQSAKWRAVAWIPCVWLGLAGVLTIISIFNERGFDYFGFVSMIPAILMTVAALWFAKKYLLKEKPTIDSTPVQRESKKRGAEFYLIAFIVLGFGAAFLFGGIYGWYYPLTESESPQYNQMVCIISIAFGSFIIWKWYQNEFKN